MRKAEEQVQRRAEEEAARAGEKDARRKAKENAKHKAAQALKESSGVSSLLGSSNSCSPKLLSYAIGQAPILAETPSGKDGGTGKGNAAPDDSIELLTSWGTSGKKIAQLNISKASSAGYLKNFVKQHLCHLLCVRFVRFLSVNQG